MSTLLSIKNLTITFQGHEELLTAVDSISFDLKKGETLAIVGESGSGKSVTALALTKLLPSPPSCLVTGTIMLEGQDILQLHGEPLRKIRGKRIAYIFQEPSTSLNPVFSISYQIAEALKLHRPEITNRNAEIIRLLDLVGIRQPEKRLHDYPHQLSGGMQQRVMIAMALACQPDILVADEPTTALDVTIQAQIMALLKELKEKLSMSIIIITHNFGIVHGFADHVLVMYKGKIVEQGTTAAVLGQPQHPYTQALINCIPRLGQKKNRLTTIDYSKIA
ncbi:MAG: ABC transporter ATP-binding protein [Blastochloris sp.]|nr:ABC transporter ATP-binding protein [Blastochloris sp.]